MEKSVARRTEELRVKLAPSLSAEFSAIAQGRGVLPATLAALALGEYVEKWRRDRQIAQMVAIDISKRMVEETGGAAVDRAMTQILSDPSMLAILASPDGAGGGHARGSGSSAGPEAAAVGTPAA